MKPLVFLHFHNQRSFNYHERLVFQERIGLQIGETMSISTATESLPHDLHRRARALILGGSARSTFEQPDLIKKMKPLFEQARECRLPILGICFGAQLIVEVFGGKVERRYEHEEFGTFPIQLTDPAQTDRLFQRFPKKFHAHCSHQDAITKLPPHGILLATSSTCPIQAFRLHDTPIYGVQFHPERTRQLAEHRLNQPADLTFMTPLRQQKIRETLQDTPEAEGLLQNFLTLAPQS